MSVVVAGMIMASSPAWAVLLMAKAAYWRMNETSGKMIDSSRHTNRGTPRNVVRTGTTYVFNGTTSRVVVPDHASLDPAGEGITLRAYVRVPNHAMDDDSYDIVRKGLSGTGGGDYKMEIKRTTNRTIGNLHCLFGGSRGTVSKVARGDIVDGRWHTLECVKTSDSVVAKVDGRSYTKAGSAGSISSSTNVLVGAKKVKPFDDVFDGSMDFVSIDISQ